MLRYFYLILGLALLAIIAIAGWRGTHSDKPPLELFPDMKRQPKVRAQRESRFFADGAASRMPVAGTVSRQEPAALDYASTGKMGDKWGDGIPIEIDAAAMARGQERYMINCAICHGPLGDGQGVVAKIGIPETANLQQDRIRQMADGEIFNVITNGKGEEGKWTMFPYRANISIEDRWKIIAYLRALQRSQNMPLAEVPEPLREQLNTVKK
jgi:mono/diheme cytochrome c family protein